WARAQPLAKTRPVDELHDEVGRVGVEHRVEEGHDARVGEACEEAHLGAAATCVAQLVGDIREALDGDVAAERLIVCPEHLARAAPAAPLDEPISAAEQFAGEQEGHLSMVSRMQMRRTVLEARREQAYRTAIDGASEAALPYPERV